MFSVAWLTIGVVLILVLVYSSLRFCRSIRKRQSTTTSSSSSSSSKKNDHPDELSSNENAKQSSSPELWNKKLKSKSIENTNEDEESNDLIINEHQCGQNFTIIKLNQFESDSNSDPSILKHLSNDDEQDDEQVI